MLPYETTPSLVRPKGRILFLLNNLDYLNITFGSYDHGRTPKPRGTPQSLIHFAATTLLPDPTTACRVQWDLQDLVLLKGTEAVGRDQCKYRFWDSHQDPKSSKGLEGNCLQCGPCEGKFLIPHHLVPPCFCCWTKRDSLLICPSINLSNPSSFSLLPSWALIT